MSEFPNRVLVIGAASLNDMIRAGQLVRQFINDRKEYAQRPGRNHGIIYNTQGHDNPAYLWYTPTQITVHYGVTENGNGNTDSAD